MTKKSRSRLWFLAHSWLALPIWFFVLAVCVTGTVAVISQELVWLANPEVRAPKPSDDARPLNFDEIIKTIHEAQPELDIRYILRPDEAYLALQVQVSRPDHSTRNLYVNPYTGKIQGVQSFDFRGFLRALHGWWLVPVTRGYPWGWYLVSALALPMLASLVTGLVVYKRFWKGFLKPTLRFNHGARVFWGDCHRLGGIWSIWFILLISITGSWFLIQPFLADNHITMSRNKVATSLAYEKVPTSHSGRPGIVSLEHALSNVMAQIPAFQASFVRMPGNAFDTVSFRGRSSYPLVYDTVSTSPYSGTVQSARTLAHRSAFELVTESMRPLHTGDFGGLWLKGIWFLFGLVLSVLILSGLLIWSKRTAVATASALKRAARKNETIEPASAWRSLWPAWRFHLSILLIAVPVFFLPRYFADQALFKGERGLGEREAGVVVVGPWKLHLAESRVQPPKPLKSFEAALCEACIGEVKAVYLHLGKPSSLKMAGSLLSGSPYDMSASISIAADSPTDSELWITMEGWNGAWYQASLPLSAASPTTVNWLKQQRRKL